MKAIKLSVVKSAKPLDAVMRLVVGLNRSGLYRKHEHRVTAINNLLDHDLVCDEYYRHALSWCYPMKVCAKLYQNDEVKLSIGRKYSSLEYGPMTDGANLAAGYNASSEYIYITEWIPVGEKLQLNLLVVSPYNNPYGEM